MTLGQFIREVEKRFKAARLHYGHGTHNARDEAAFLVLRGLGLPFDTDLDLEVTDTDVRRVEPLIRKRVKDRVPVPYLLQEAWLGEHAFYVDERVIVPRSHIAELLRDHLKPWIGRPVRRILDLCTGSGCLAIVAAHEYPNARVDAVDISTAALSVARKNVAQHRLKRRVRLVHSDLLNRLMPDAQYDLIVTNPPYVTGAAMRKLPAEYRHEPHLALAGGVDGLDLVHRILEEAPRHLSARGLLVCEIGDNRRALERAHPGMPFMWPETEAGTGQVFILEASRTSGASRTRARQARARR